MFKNLNQQNPIKQQKSPQNKKNHNPFKHFLCVPLIYSNNKKIIKAIYRNISNT